MESEESFIVNHDHTPIKADDLTKLIISTGNVANWKSLKSRKITHSPSIELYHSLIQTLDNWSQSDVPYDKLSGEYHIQSDNTGLDTRERELVKVTVKIFLHKFDETFIDEAVSKIMAELKTKYVDSIFLAFPSMDNFEEVIGSYWKVMERLKETGVTTHISSCDLDEPKLKFLIQNSMIKPEVNQVNLASCCHMPEDLVAYAKEAGVQLHTHGDQQVMLPNDTLEPLLKTKFTTQRSWETNWVVKYAVVLKCRGVIQSKGYISCVTQAQ